MKAKYIEIPDDDYEAFVNLHPGHGSFTWFVREALRKYLKLHEVTPNELIELAVADINNID